MTLPDPSAWREQNWEEMLPLENREVMETVKTLTQNHKAKVVAKIASTLGILAWGIGGSSILLTAAGVKTQKAKREKVTPDPGARGQRRDGPYVHCPAHPENSQQVLEKAAQW
eukprot:bmy_07648T0